MQSIETLMHEHRIIEHGLAILQRLASQCQNAQPVDPPKVQAVLDFFQVFADRCHHAKEEGTLFPELERRGIPRAGGPIGVMLHDHERGRHLLAKMRQAVEHWDQPNQREQFSQAALEYVQHLRQHIWKEDNVLFRLAQQLLTAYHDAAMLRQFEELERHQLGEGVHERYHQWIHELQRELGITPAEIAVVSPAAPNDVCGCEHAEHYHEQAGLP